MRDIVVIGASAGAIAALREIIRPLPANFQGAIFVVVHVPAESPSVLPQILSGAGALKAAHPSDGERIVPSRIYVAPPDHHMLIEPGQVRIGIVRPLSMRYAVLDSRRLVMVGALPVLLPKAEDQASE